MKNLLTLIGISTVALATSWGQNTIPTNIGGVINITNTDAPAGSEWHGTLNGSYTNTGTTTTWPSYYGPTRMGIPTGTPMLTFTDGLGSKIVFWNDNGTLKPAEWTRIKTSIYTGTEEGGRAYFNSAGEVWQGINITTNWSVGWNGGGMGPGYTPPTTPGPEVNGGGDVIADQAVQLNIGLTFQSGQWTPAQ